MKKTTLTIFLILIPSLLFPMMASSALAKKPSKIAKLKYEKEFIFQKMLEYKKQEFNPNIPMPKVFVESQTPIKQFQDAIETQWGQRPNIFTNAYAVKNNEIYLLDDAGYYSRLKRCMDDSLAHEYVHFIQAKYQNFDLNDEFLEMEAIEHQTRFREEFCQ